MKSNCFLTIALFTALTFSTASAQVAIKAGINIASMSQDAYFDDYNDVENNSVVGFQGGLAFDLMPSSMFSIQPEVLFVQKGSKFRAVGNDDNNLTNRLYYNYLEVPLLAKLKFNTDTDGEGIGIYLIAGPFISYALNGRSESSVTLDGEEIFNDDVDINFDDDDAEDHQRRLDYGAAFGAGLQFGNLFLDARYNLGFNNLLDDDADNDNDNDPYLRTRGIGLTLGYQF